MSVGTAASDTPGHRPVRALREHTRALTGNTGALLVLALTALAAALRFYRLGHQGFWFDEANTAQLVHFSLGKMLGLIPQTESTPPLYYCVAWVWARVFGYGEAGLRSLSATAGVLSVPVLYAASAKLVSRRAGVIAAALCACNPLLIWYSQEARSYSLLVLLCATSLLAFAYALEAPSARRLAIWVLVSALALATHYYAVVSIAPEVLWLAVVHRRRREVQVGVAIVAACGLALIPLALSQNSTGHDSWIAHSPLGLRLAQIVPQLLIGTGAPARELLKFVAFALAAGALAMLFWRASPIERRRAALPGVLAGGGFVLSLTFVAAGSDALITRNIIALWIPAAIALAAGLGAARARVAGIAVTVALCAVGLTAAIGVAANYDLQRPDWRAVAQLLGPAPAPGTERVILVQHYRTLLPLSLYLHGLRFLRAPAASHVRELDVISISSPQQPLCWWGAACNLIPSQMQASYAVPGFRPLWRRRVLRFTILRLVSTRPLTLTRAALAAALTTTRLRRDELLVQR